MSIKRLMKRSCTQTAVYWGSPVKDGYNHFTFASPVEIKCRWVERLQMVKNEVASASFLSRAYIFVNQELDLEGYVFLGTLSDIPSKAFIDPHILDFAYQVKLNALYQSLNKPEFVIKKYYLAEYLNY